LHVTGIVAEYNPFHNGHKYHLEATKSMGATHTVAVMSSSFVQRAEPAIINKFDRARMAATMGVDLVLELPLAYSLGVSERFAYGAISILNELGVVDSLSFGSEAGDILVLQQTVEALDDARVIRRIKQLTEVGESYPSAQEKALEVFYPELAVVVRGANNILGINYIKALKKLDSKIEPLTIERYGAMHDSNEIQYSIASASRIRDIVRQRGGFGSLVPHECNLILLDASVSGKISGSIERIESAVLYKLRGMTNEQMNQIPDAATGLGDRIYHAVQTASSIEELYDESKTKRYTMSRVRRAVLNAFLDITEKDYATIPYIRILAIGQNGSDILKAMKRRCSLKVSGSPTELIELRGIAAETIKKEMKATDIYNLTLTKRGPTGDDYTTKLFTY